MELAGRMLGDVIFLSTPSARRATPASVQCMRRAGISIHALREEGDQGITLAGAFFDISIHALREEGDSKYFRHSWWNSDFYPRPPRGGRPRCAGCSPLCFSDFYPRPPRGGRRHLCRVPHGLYEISIHVLREEGDCCGKPIQDAIYISIHALREEGDRSAVAVRGFRLKISIHALREEGDHSRLFSRRKPPGFLSTPSARRATRSDSSSSMLSQFLSTPSARRATPTRLPCHQIS